VEKEKKRELKRKNKNKLNRNNLLEILEQRSTENKEAEPSNDISEQKKAEDKDPMSDMRTAESKTDAQNKDKYTPEETEKQKLTEGLNILRKEIEKLGYEDDGPLIDEIIQQRGIDIHLILECLLNKEKKKV